MNWKNLTWPQKVDFILLFVASSVLVTSILLALLNKIDWEGVLIPAAAFFSILSNSSVVFKKAIL